MEILSELYKIYNLALERIYNFLETIIDPLVGFYLDNPMFKIVLAFVPAILGIAYPLILQTISRLDSQYKSTHIIEKFKKESRHKMFVINLKISVFLTLLSFILSVDIFVLAFISVVSLIIFFFRYLNLLLNYQSGKSLFDHYSKKVNITPYLHKNSDNKTICRVKNEIIEFWYPIIDLFLYSIRNKSRILETDITKEFIYPAFNFIKYIEQNNVELVEYPISFYKSSFDIVSNYLNNYPNDYNANIETFVGSIFFPAYSNTCKKQYYHQDTLITIWKNLVLLVEHCRNDKIIRYWELAHHHFISHLRQQPQYDDEYNETKESFEERKKNDYYRNIFLQFHTVFCSYLMYKGYYRVLRELWYHTHSSIPDYALIPQNMTEIFQYYFVFHDNNISNQNIAIDYWFKDLEFESINKIDVKYIIKRYSCLLFIKQWKTEGLYGLDPLTYPELPRERAEQESWKEDIENFKEIVKDHLNNNEMLDELGLDGITEEWCSENKLDYPTEYLDKLKQTIEEGTEEELIKADLDKSKIYELDKSSSSILSEVYSNFRRISGKEIDKEERDTVSSRMEVIRGTTELLDKEVFVSNQKVQPVNYDKVVAKIILQEYIMHIASKFFSNKSKSFELPYGESFEAIDRLELDPTKHVIISFNSNLEYIKDLKNIELEQPQSDENFRYKSIPIYSFNYYFPLVNKTLYVLEKSDLPMIKHKDWSDITGLPEEAQAYWESMQKKIDDESKLYRRIVDLNTSTEIRNNYLNHKGFEESDIKNKVEVVIDFLGYCWFKKGANLIEIREAKRLQEKGTKDYLKNIKPLTK